MSSRSKATFFSQDGRERVNAQDAIFGAEVSRLPGTDLRFNSQLGSHMFCQWTVPFRSFTRAVVVTRWTENVRGVLQAKVPKFLIRGSAQGTSLRTDPHGR